MTLSIWRYAHLVLAVVSSLFLLILSVTGVILAVDAVDEKLPSYRIDNFGALSLAQSLPALNKAYPEIIELSVDHNGFVTLDATDEEGNSVKAYIDPRDGSILGPLKPKSEFIQWNIALHRSLFLKETGRIIVGVVSFLLLLIAISGSILIIKRQQGIRHFLTRIKRDFFAQYFHVVSGRLALIPVIIIALTGTYLFMVRIGVIENVNREIEHQAEDEAPHLPLDEFPVFLQTRLAEVEKIEFPFIPDDPEEHFILKLKDRALTVSQLTGAVLEESRYPYTAALEKLSLDLHTGRTNALWAIILGIASLNIIAFIYSGFVITFRRARTKIRNQFKAGEAEIVILTGTENGSTLFFANEIHRQMLADGKKSYITEMNRYEQYPNAEHILVFTSTYGLGTAPASAVNFERLVLNTPQKQGLLFSVVGFGSKAYPDFCGYAMQIDLLLAAQSWAARSVTLHTVNDRSAEEFTGWVHTWNQQSGMKLTTAPARYSMKATGLKTLKIKEKTTVDNHNDTFRMLLAPEPSVNFQSGDLLAIYPANDGRERLYSVARCDGMIQLIVKLYPGGLGSGYLYGLEVNDKIKAKVMRNPGFHFPQKPPAVAMISNGTGIAPFLGMVMENKKSTPVYLYAGFRYDNELVGDYRERLTEEKAKKRLSTFRFALSRGKMPQYVMDLVRDEAAFFAELLENKGIVMICGSLTMQKDVETALNELCLELNRKTLSHYKALGQILTDCY